MKPSGGYNRDGRGYPDVSAIAVRYSVVIANDFYSIYGTSASAPVIAGMITLVNGLRAAQNRSSIGWINRALYDASNNKSSSIFNDIVRGSNNCCSSTQCQSDSLICCEGFESISGWDPVTGLGSLNFPSLASTFSVKAPEYPESSGWRSNIPLSDLELYTLLALASIIICCLCSCFIASLNRRRANQVAQSPLRRPPLVIVHPPLGIRPEASAPTAPLPSVCPFCNVVYFDDHALAVHINANHPE